MQSSGTQYQVGTAEALLEGLVMNPWSEKERLSG